MEILGREIEVGIATEESRGTAESTVDKWMKKVTANVVERAEHVMDDTSQGRLEDSEQRRVVQKYIEGDLQGPIHADALGYFLSNLYGKVSTSIVDGSVKDHEFTLQQGIQHNSLTIFDKSGSAQQRKYVGCMVTSLELNAAIDDLVRFTANIVGKEAESDTETPSYDTEYDFIARDIEVKIEDTEGDLPGGDAIKVKELSLTWDQSVIRDHVVGSYIPDDNYNSRMAIEGSFTLNFTDETYKDLYLGDDAKYMQITITGEADIGSGNNPTITILLNKVQFQDWNREGGQDELVTEPISFKAFYNQTDTQQSKVTLRNLTSEYSFVPSN